MSDNDKEKTLQRVVEFVNQQAEAVSVKDIAEGLDLSKSYSRELAKEAVEKSLFDGKKDKPVIGYIFNRDDRARTDGGQREGELRVLTTRDALLQAVRDHAPQRLPEARGKALQELRKFVRKEVADGTTPVSHAWSFYPN